MIEGLLPPDVVAVDTREDLLDIELFPAERAALGQAVEKRRREFVTARACARQALAQPRPAPLPDRHRRARGAVLAGGGGGEPHPLCGLSRVRACARARPRGGGHRRRAPRAAARGGARGDRPRGGALGAGRSLQAPNRRSTGTGCCSARRRRCTRCGSPSPGAGWASRTRRSRIDPARGPSRLVCWFPGRR